MGNYPGHALSFVVRKSKPDESPTVLAYPSKDRALWCPEGGTLIFRSDSNGEDLEGYAGAGLFDSIAMDGEEERMVAYADDPLVHDPVFQAELLTRIGAVGIAVEKALGGQPQDIEGVVDVDGRITVVQTRPQV